MSIREKLEERKHAEDVKALAMALPLGARRVRMRIKCDDPGCGWVREQKVTMSDRKASDAFEDTLKEARIHEALSGHHGVKLTLEPL